METKFLTWIGKSIYLRNLRKLRNLCKQKFSIEVVINVRNLFVNYACILQVISDFKRSFTFLRNFFKKVEFFKFINICKLVFKFV